MDKRLICVIDDDEIFVYGTKMLMSKVSENTDVINFKNGQAAILRLERVIQNIDTCPDIILLDVNMPVLNGWGFLDQFVKLKPAKNIKIFMVSSSVRPEDKIKAESYDVVQDYVVKPITVEGLNRMIHL